ncbi:MAG: 23S rRNA (adenine(2503)-C(2))-methyltransferase RlmN [Actinobacteria bacterium]|nr:23S rRNA (adenine(2503)-C(2))-methyltransferase RlmN [Actinomycetota bacterium]
MVDVKKLKELLKDEPSYRITQAERAIYKDFVSDWSQVTTLPLPLRERLQSELPLDISAELLISSKKDTLKAVITLKDGFSIESVLMRHADKKRSKTGGGSTSTNKEIYKCTNEDKDKIKQEAVQKFRNTVCESSQIGCPLSCLFCTTGKLEFKRNLTADEIVDQVLFFSRYLKEEGASVNNVVFMGMGEPFLNYDNVMSAVRILNDKNKFNIGARHISISTCGIPERIYDFAKEGLQVNLAISLNAPNDEIRSRLMPINKRYPIGELLKTVKFYIEKTNRRVMFEYVMVQDLNDAPSHAKELARLVKGLLCFVNLIPCNASPYNFLCHKGNWDIVYYKGNRNYQACLTDDKWGVTENVKSVEGRSSSSKNGSIKKSKNFESINLDNLLKPSTRKRISEFKKILSESGITVTERFRFGVDIRGACGELVYRFKKG